MDTIKATAAKGLEEGRKEQELMEKFEAQSLKSQKKLSEDIADNKAAKKKMEDESAAKKAAKRNVEENIEVSENEISNLEAAATAAKENRDEEIQVENLTKQEHNQTIAAMKEAISALEEDENETKEAGKTELKASKDYAGEAAAAVSGLLAEKVPSQKVLSLASVRQASEFALLKLDRLSKEEQEMLTSISEEEEDSPLAGRAPPKKQYKFKSGKVIDLLKKMQMEYEDELQATLMASQKAQMEYDLAKGSRDETIRVATDKLGKLRQHEADLNSTLAGLAVSMKDPQGEIDSDSQTLQDRQMTLKLKKDEFKQAYDAYLDAKEKLKSM